MDATITRRAFAESACVAAVAGMAGALGMNASQPSVAKAETLAHGTRVSEKYTNDELDAMILDESPVNGDYTAPDGTVIPALYLKLRNRVNRIGYGTGSDIEGNGTEWNFLMRMFSEDDAEHYLEMPMYRDFNATDYAAITGRDIAECAAILEDMGSRGLLCTRNKGGVNYYHLLTSEWGIWEYNLDRFYEDGFMEDHNNRAGSDMAVEINDIFRPQLNVLPVSKGIVEGQMAPYTDWEEIFNRNEIIGVAPCQCRTRAHVLGIQTDECADSHPAETCMIFGDVAKYYIERGEARQLTREEAIALQKDVIDHGAVPEAQWTKQVDFMCNCFGDCCLILTEYEAANGVGNVMPQVSRYNLAYDTDTCIGCGACVSRCPLHAITIEDGVCVMDRKCVRCGQCALVCPVEARHLEAKPSEEWMELPDDMLADYLDSARRRAAAGMLFDFTEDGPTQPAVEKYTSSDGFTLDRQDTSLVTVNPAEVLQSVATGANATDRDVVAIAQDGDLSEVIHDPDLLAYNKENSRYTEPTDAAKGIA